MRNRKYRSDGRMIPRLGDRVMRWGVHMLGFPVVIEGVVCANGRRRFVRADDGDCFPFGPRWSIVDDPIVMQAERKREKIEADRRAKKEADDDAREAEWRARDARLAEFRRSPDVLIARPFPHHCYELLPSLRPGDRLESIDGKVVEFVRYENDGLWPWPLVRWIVPAPEHCSLVTIGDVSRWKRIPKEQLPC